MKQRFNLKYVPRSLSRKDKQLVVRMLRQSQTKYPQHAYQTRKKVASFKSRPSKHVAHAMKLYGVPIFPNKRLASKTGCSVNALQQIVKKGQGAYYSSGSRPNQTAHSWGLARLASAVSGGKSAAVDFNILQSGCNHNKRAYKLALQSRKKHKYGHRATRKITVQV